MTLGRFVAALAWCWFAALLISAVAIGAAKLWPLEIDGQLWAIGWIGGMLSLGLLFALVWSWLRRENRLNAAVEIDRRFGLKERVSSTLALSPEVRETEIGRALVDDAARRVERLDVASRFKIPLERRNLLPLLPAALLVGLAFIADKLPEQQATAAQQPAVTQQVQQSADALTRKLAQHRKEANEKGLQDAGELFKKIEEGARQIASKEGSDRKQALVKLNDLAKQLESRRDKLAGDDKLKQQLNEMKDLKEGPADKLADALKNGRFEKALKQLDKLRDQLKDGKLESKDQAKLAEQLEAMRQTIQKLADKHDQTQRDLERQIKQLTAAGKPSDAQKLQQQLDKLQRQTVSMNALKSMADKLGAASKCLKSGGSKPGEQAGQQACQSLKELADQVSDLKQQNEEQALIDSALDQISEAKSSMTGSKGDGQSEGGQGQDRDQIAGETSGGGKAKASGRRPEKKGEFKLFDSTVKQQLGKGAAVSAGETDGPNIRGQVQAEIKAQIESAKHDSADPLTGQRLPRSQREHAKEYFDSLREGN